MSYHPNQAGPDLVITIDGKRGAGKSCLAGDIAAMLELYGCEVRMYHRPFNSVDDYRVPLPKEGHFNEVRKVKIVEVLG
jgi:cytidylate kinase